MGIASAAVCFVVYCLDSTAKSLSVSDLYGFVFFLLHSRKVEIKNVLG